MAAMLSIYQGDTLPVSLLLKDADDNLFDLTGYSAEVWMRWGENDEEELDDPVLGGVAGTITGTFSSSQTETFPEGKRVKMFLKLTDPDGGLTTTLVARVLIKHDE